MPYSGTIKNLYIFALTGPTATTNAFTIRLNGVDTTLTATLAVAGTTASDLVHSFAVVAGDQISCKIVTAGGGSGAHNVNLTMEISS